MVLYLKQKQKRNPRLYFVTLGKTMGIITANKHYVSKDTFIKVKLLGCSCAGGREAPKPWLEELLSH